MARERKKTDLKLRKQIERNKAKKKNPGKTTKGMQELRRLDAERSIQKAKSELRRRSKNKTIKRTRHPKPR